MLKQIQYIEQPNLKIFVNTEKPEHKILLKVSDIPKKLRDKSWEEGDYVVGLRVGSIFGLAFESLNSTAFGVVPSIKGINPLTGLKAHAQPHRYGRGTKCPEGHDVLLQKDGYCNKCDHNWPINNYVSVDSRAVLPGWVTAKGEVRPFKVMKDMAKDIATFQLGENAPSSIGLAVYEGKSAQRLSYSLGGSSTGTSWWENYNPYTGRWGNTGPIWLYQPYFFNTTTGSDVTLTTSCGAVYSTSNTANCQSTFTSSLPGGIPKAMDQSSLDEHMKASLKAISIGAGEVQEHSMPDHQIEIETLEEDPLGLFIHPISFELAEALINEVNGKVESGPFKGIPTDR